MAKVIMVRPTISKEKGDFLFRVEIYKGRKEPPQTADLFISINEREAGKMHGEVADGCINGLNLHALGDKVFIQQTPENGRFIGSDEKG